MLFTLNLLMIVNVPSLDFDARAYTINDIKMGPILGEGEFGVVHLATILATNETVAMKVLKSEESRLMLNLSVKKPAAS